MLKKSIEAIIADGVAELEEIAKRAERKGEEAAEQVARCKSEIQTLVALAKDVPEKVFDRHSNVLVSTIEIGGVGGSSQIWAEFRLNGSGVHLRGLMGDEQVKPGKYRVIVLLEPLS
jgi:hypothetical protein